MAEARELNRGSLLHPLHAILLAGTLPLFLGAVLSDWAYSGSYEIQWANFSAWLGAGGLIFAGLALLWALIDNLRGDRGGHRHWLYFLLLLATVIVGFINALIHARDGWAMMPTGFILSAITLILCIAAISAAFAGYRAGGAR